MAPRRVSKTNLEKREVTKWIEGPGGGVPTRALKHFQAERGWKCQRPRFATGGRTTKPSRTPPRCSCV
uniref:Uncharacterized protein n=1 Tax=Hyaloperonospora arabidopsidis (strain Emoy2) TaxID=559515 RepID=M4BP19_HYAAE